jgi:sterol desaturase/sphingolipid hydroxylase (fatty acid hydroxylase superfamily)
MDTEFDVSTGIRFHPGEILFSYAYKALIVYFLGIPVEAIILFEFTLTLMSIFTHSNLNIPDRAQDFLNLIFVTPNMHRIHHSDVYSEHNKNFGFSLSIWDKFFRTFLKSASLPQNKIHIGLKEVNQDQGINLVTLLTSPFFTKKEVKRN